MVSSGDAATRRRSTRIVILGIVMMVATVVVGRWIYHVATRSDPKADPNAARIVLPERLGSYRIVTDSDALELTAVFTKAVKEVKGVTFNHAVFASRDGHRFFVYGLSAHDTATINAALSQTSSTNVIDQAFHEAGVISSVDYDPKPFTGTLRCGDGVGGGGPDTPVCAWSDHDTFAMVIDVSVAAGHRALTVSSLSTLTRQLRAAAER